MVGEFHRRLVSYIFTPAQLVFVRVCHQHPVLQPPVVYISREPNLFTLFMIFFLPEATVDIWLHGFQPLFFVPHHSLRVHRALSALRLGEDCHFFLLPPPHSIMYAKCSAHRCSCLLGLVKDTMNKCNNRILEEFQCLKVWSTCQLGKRLEMLLAINFLLLI